MARSAVVTAPQPLATFEGSELHLHVSGSISASLVPWWINWIRFITPEVVINVSVSSRATSFVTVGALQGLANGEVWLDDWETPGLPHSWRNGRSGNSECIIVFPATLDTVMRLAQGRADSPALMMLQITDLPIVLADVFPAENAVINHWREVLLKRPNIAFAPQIDTPRADDRKTTTSGFNLPGALATANEAIAASRV
ncbi:CypD family RiPP peptide-cysteine decarboxylase [Rathayibacter rathayi]|uniref:CypD family RiPP peptide-cysteine decarboxylase n=1 Tax=Rathayibacter rathayi TaxID=33887 RepID=UPI001CA5264F|nr:CypD family RiPP peptide-cysteine decarboxylase [Rathayibacter rathayi]